MAMVAIDLLADGGATGKKVIDNHRPSMSKSAYLRFQRERAEIIEFDGSR
jgi:hypothetical protein